MKTQTTPFDASQHINTKNEQLAYLHEFLSKPEDESLIVSVFIEVAKAQHLTIEELATKAGMSVEELEAESEKPKYSTIIKLADALNLTLVAVVKPNIEHQIKEVTI